MTQIPQNKSAPLVAADMAASQTLTPLQHNEIAERTKQFVAAATSENTRKSYRSAIRHYLSWGGLLPAEEQNIVAYLVSHATTLSTSTLALRLTAISQWHVYQGFQDPTATPLVRKTLSGIGRTHGRPPKKALALTVDELACISMALAKRGDLKSVRDAALLQIGFFGGFRRSELIALRVENIIWKREGVLITLPRSKTDQVGQGITKAIPFGQDEMCPATSLKAWLDAAQISDGPIFRSLNRWGSVSEKAVSAGSINLILVECARLAGLDHAIELSSHSLRRGMATSASIAGASFRDIKRQGGWRNDATVQGYIDEADQFASNAAGKLLNKKTTVDDRQQ